MGQLRQQSFDNRAPTTEPAAGSGWSDPATAPEAGSGWASTGAVSVTADPADPTDATGSSQQQGRQLVLEAGQVFPQYIPTSAAAGNGGKRGGCPSHGGCGTPAAPARTTAPQLPLKLVVLARSSSGGGGGGMHPPLSSLLTPSRSGSPLPPLHPPLSSSPRSAAAGTIAFSGLRGR